MGRSREGLSTKIHVIVDEIGCPIYTKITEGQKSNSIYGIDILSYVNIEVNDILADKKYDSDKIIDYIYENGGELTIPPKTNRTVQRKCDWNLYKERHLVECFFQKLKNYR
ncbi:MAG: transposase [Clostridiales bacterium]